jgi:UDP-N-acetylenolpyruvoylglucosamine reductase
MDAWGKQAEDRDGALCGVLSAASRIRIGESMARRTSMRVGGKADLWVEPGDETDLQRLLEVLRSWGLDRVVVGAGTNLIVSDSGIRGAVIRLSGPGFQRLYAGSEGVRAGAGVYLRHIVRAAAEAGRTGLEFFEGIPGTVGGALAMNAGAMGREFFQVVESVRFMDDAGSVAIRPGGSFEVGYRHCPFFHAHIGLEVQLMTAADESVDVHERVREFLDKRKSSQPIGPSAGCIFRNPGPGESAGRLIDQAGLKGLREGGAVVSEVHGNFILNTDGATATDLARLIKRVREGVFRKSGVDLEREVIYLGEFEEEETP